MSWVAAESDTSDRLRVVLDALALSPEGPSYGPTGVYGLEIGGGPHPKRLGHTQYDACDWPEVKHYDGRNVKYDLGDARQLPYPDGTFDHVFSCNLLEHFPSDETVPVLTEWARVLRPHGALEIVVPDFMGILRDYFEYRINWVDTQERILGSQDYDGNRHYTAFTKTDLPEIIQQIPGLEPVVLESCHSGGGARAIALKTN